MLQPVFQRIISLFCVAWFVVLPLRTGNATAQSVKENAQPQVTIGGAVTTPLTLTLADLKAMPRATLHVTDSHTGKAEVYEGVLLEALLQKAGAAIGEKHRGPLMMTYVAAEGSDAYRVVFSLAELDSDFMSSEVLVADTVDGGPIDSKRGPFRLIAPHDKRPARWVRMLKSITVVTPKD